METLLHKSMKEVETKVLDQSHGNEESCGEEIILQVGDGKRVEEDNELKPPSTNQKRLNKLDEQLESTKVEMDEVMEENKRLKMYLDRILKDYRTLQNRYRDIVQQDQKPNDRRLVSNPSDQTEEEPEFIALSLGRSLSSDLIKDEHCKAPLPREQGEKKDFTLGLDCRFDRSYENSVEEVKEEAEETWSDNKTMKNARDGGDEDLSLQNPAKRVRVSVRVRCDTPTVNDGCQWRKYGQKIAKGNPCPRAYYRCTVAPSCPVRKQVQRCSDDVSILTTTYEGTHNHPLPHAATAMASTTSAAASMLMSGLSTSGSGLSSSCTTTAASTTTATLNGINFYLSDNSRSKPYYLPNSSISPSPSIPTITLDLTSNSVSSLSHLNRVGHMIPSSNLNFNSLESTALPIPWGNGTLANYGSNPFNNNHHQSKTSSLSFGTQNYETLYQSFFSKNPNPNNNPQSLPLDTVAAATKAITSDPNFQSVLAAALSSIIGSGVASTSTLRNQNIGEKFSQNVKPNGSEPFPILSSFPLASSSANKCTSSFLNNSLSSTSSQPRALKFLSPSFTFSNVTSKPSSPGDKNIFGIGHDVS